jgi:hypothetical protein
MRGSDMSSGGRVVVVLAARVVFDESGAAVSLSPARVEVVADGAELHDASNIAAYARDASRRITIGG